jgi:hypothetical protein
MVAFLIGRFLGGEKLRAQTVHRRHVSLHAAGLPLVGQRGVLSA